MAAFLIYSRAGALQGKEKTAEKAIVRARSMALLDGYADVVKPSTHSRRRFYASGRVKSIGKRKETSHG